VEVTLLDKFSCLVIEEKTYHWRESVWCRGSRALLYAIWMDL